jgi:myo-inositol 2-dehydrogenase / D-chiro-inositol 1-dehydrogenase
MTALKVAIIGTGWWAGQHLRALSAQRDVEVVAVCGRTPEKVAKRAHRYGAKPFIDVDEMLRETTPDLVTVCTANQHHYAPTLALLQSGVAVLTEKPLVFDLAEADRLLEEADRRNAFFAICFNHRYAKAVKMAKNVIDSGRLGQLVLVDWRFGGEGGIDHPFNNLVETQCHGFDLIEHLAGPIDSIAAHFCDRRAAGIQTTLSLSLGLENGAVGSMVGSYDASYAHPRTHRLELLGTQGRVIVDDTVKRMTFSPHGSETSEVWEPGYFNDVDRQFQLTLDAYLADMLNALRVGGRPPVPAISGHRALRLAHAAIKSASTGTLVSTASH